MEKHININEDVNITQDMLDADMDDAVQFDKNIYDSRDSVDRRDKHGRIFAAGFSQQGEKNFDHIFGRK